MELVCRLSGLVNGKILMSNDHARSFFFKKRFYIIDRGGIHRQCPFTQVMTVEKNEIHQLPRLNVTFNPPAKNRGLSTLNKRIERTKTRRRPEPSPHNRCGESNGESMNENDA